MKRSVLKSLIPLQPIAIGAMAASFALMQTAGAFAQQKEKLREPVYRISSTRNEPAKANGKAEQPAKHQLDPALDMARKGLEQVRGELKDYKCVLVKRERIKGELKDHEYIFMKVRNRQYKNDQLVTPFSVYMYFLKPIKGREVMYVEGQNGGKLCAHEGGAAGRVLPTVWLDPHGPFAMKDQLYPITDVGIENLILKLIERGTGERKFKDVEVTFKEKAKVNDRSCTLLEIKHPNQRPEFEFYYAQIFIDDEYKVPIRYAAYDWPVAAGDEPQVIEEYTYLKIEMNVGLTDKDFSTDNPDYNF